MADETGRELEKMVDEIIMEVAPILAGVSHGFIEPIMETEQQKKLWLPVFNFRQVNFLDAKIPDGILVKLEEKWKVADARSLVGLYVLQRCENKGDNLFFI